MRLVPLLLMCFVTACAPEPPPVLPYGAAVGFEGTSFVLLSYDPRALTDATLTLEPGGYSATVADVPAKGRIAVPSTLFATAAGERFNPYRIKPQRVTIAATMDGQPMTLERAFVYR